MLLQRKNCIHPEQKPQADGRAAYIRTHAATLFITYWQFVIVSVSDCSSMKQQRVLSVPECGALDIDSSQNRCVGVCKWGHVVEGSGRTARRSDDYSGGSRDIFRGIFCCSWILKLNTSCFRFFIQCKFFCTTSVLAFFRQFVVKVKKISSQNSLFLSYWRILHLNEWQAATEPKTFIYRWLLSWRNRVKRENRWDCCKQNHHLDMKITRIVWTDDSY